MILLAEEEIHLQTVRAELARVPPVLGLNGVIAVVRSRYAGGMRRTVVKVANRSLGSAP